VPREKAVQPEVLIAYQMNGRDLSRDHGYPGRAIVPGHYGNAFVRWLTRIQVVQEPFHGYWQTSDYGYWDYSLDGTPVRRHELVGGALVCVGLFTRPVAFILSGNMAIAYFAAHAPRGFFPLVNGGTAAILYCFIFFYIFFAGPGPWSLDHVLRRGTDLAEAPSAAGQRRA